MSDRPQSFPPVPDAPQAMAQPGPASLVDPAAFAGDLDLRHYLRLFWAGRWILVATAVIGIVLAFAWSMTRPKLYRTTTTLQVEPQSQQIIQNQVNVGLSFWQVERFLESQDRMFRSVDLSERVARRLGLEGGGGDAPSAAQLRGAISVSRIPNTYMINVSMVGRDPERITEWLNVYVQEYIEANIEDGLQRAQEVFRIVQEKIEPLRQQLEDSENRLTQYHERDDTVLFADEERNVVTEQVETLTTQYAQAKSARIDLQTKIDALEQLQSQQLPITSFPEIMNDGTVSELMTEKNRLQLELDEKLQVYRTGHPTIRDLSGRLEGIDGQIQRRIAQLLAALRADFETEKLREDKLLSNLESLRDQAIRLSRQSMELATLRRDYEQNKAFYEQMIQRSKEADISGTVAVNNFRIIDEARVPGGPFSPRIPRNVSLGFVLGLLAGGGIVFLLDFLDQTIRNPDDVERYLGLDTFAVVPVYAEDKKRVIREIYQGLRTALLFAARDEGGQIVAVTSTGPGEGKTTTSFNLAKVLGAGGDRVLLIDADLRRPAIHRIVGTKNVRGFTSLMLGERTLGEVTHQMESAPNLDIVTSGPLPPNPPELFGKTAFSRFLAGARQEYDWVIIDTPPVASVTDAVVCARWVDMVLMVVRYGQVERKQIQGALRQLAWSGARVVGATLNRVDVEKDHYYYDSYYYSYYHYGYAPEDEQEEGRGRRRHA